MNYSNFLHALLALIAQAVIGLSTGDWWAGAAFGGAFYLGREVAQHETDRLKYYGKRSSFGSDEGMPWYEGFKLTNWRTDAKLDLLVPTVVVVALAAFLEGPL